MFVDDGGEANPIDKYGVKHAARLDGIGPAE
jgi:hypothetical protein